jgi:DNA polymerase-3 subunit delta'
MGAEGNRQGNIPVEETRKLVQKISLKPFEAPFKVVMLWNPETLNASAGNALLKTLEEPPSSTLFILVCAEPDKLLTTIISRTQRVSIGAVDVEDLAEYLVQKAEIDSEKAHQIAVNCEGNISEALEKSNSDNLSTTTWFAEWMRAIYARNLSKLVQLADQFDGLAKENQKSILTYSLHIFRQCLYQISDASGLIKSLEKEKAFVDNFSKTLSTEKIAAMTEKISEVHYHLERNARAKMVHLDLSLHLLRVFHAKNS